MVLSGAEWAGASYGEWWGNDGSGTYRNRERGHLDGQWLGQGRRYSGYGVLVVQSPPVFFRRLASREATTGDQRVGWGGCKGGHRRALRLSLVIHMNESFRQGQKQNINTCMHTIHNYSSLFLSLHATASFSPELVHTGEELHISAFDPRRELTKDTLLTRDLPHYNPSLGSISVTRRRDFFLYRDKFSLIVS